VLKLTLDDAVAMAKANNRMSRMAGARVQEKVAAARAARAELFPKIVSEAQYQGSSGKSSVEIPAGVLGTDGTGQPLPSHSARIEQEGSQIFFSKITLDQPITPLFKISESAYAAKAAAAEMEAARRATDLDVALATEKLYLSVLMSERRREAATVLLAARRAALTDAQNAANTGMGIAARATEARAGALDAEQSVLTSEIAVEDARAELMQLLGVGRDVQLALEMPAAQPAIGALDEYLARAAQRHPDVWAAQARSEQARRGLRATKADYIPEIAVYAGHSYQDAVAFIPSNSFSAGIKARWTVLDFGRRRYEVEQRVASQQLAQESLADTREKVAIGVEKAYRNAVRAERLVAVARETLEARQAVERIAGGQTSAGLTLASKQSEAVANRVAAESALLDAELGARVARAELARAVGETASALKVATSGAAAAQERAP
jgi:outer membrane protein TolC